MSKHILVVEDREDNRRIVRDLLAATDYELTEVENGEQALMAVAKRHPCAGLSVNQIGYIIGLWRRTENQ
jgi:CheY-like chemotaxis protein